jgi:hypothetical protein
MSNRLELALKIGIHIETFLDHLSGNCQCSEEKRKTITFEKVNEKILCRAYKLIVLLYILMLMHLLYSNLNSSNYYILGF